MTQGFNYDEVTKFTSSYYRGFALNEKSLGPNNTSSIEQEAGLFELIRSLPTNVISSIGDFFLKAYFLLLRFFVLPAKRQKILISV